MEDPSTRSSEAGGSPIELISTKQMAVKGFKAQSEFGSFRISVFPNNTEGTSHSSSSCCSSSRMSDGPSKERKEELSMSGSDGEADDLHEADTDKDLTDEDNKQFDNEMEGSVDEESIKSDEE
ncbi:hypothetical protein GIB67_036279 [Kingdonia uniflora]|uniref:Uncharacterized protein n=1 Tax=Kingdonia uniflora TaxID=39325 RepID=A0A7J7L3U7_9MAGN|nr:hypothetical protein GIB67_036279 [Kingdonia uniflora]